MADYKPDERRRLILKDLQENAVDGVLQADSKEIEEIAYVLQIKITDLLPEEEE